MWCGFKIDRIIYYLLYRYCWFITRSIGIIPNWFFGIQYKTVALMDFLWNFRISQCFSTVSLTFYLFAWRNPLDYLHLSVSTYMQCNRLLKSKSLLRSQRLKVLETGSKRNMYRVETNPKSAPSYIQKNFDLLEICLHYIQQTLYAFW